MTTLEKLQRRWLRKTGEPMPEAIAQLDIAKIYVAVRLVEAGNEVFVPVLTMSVEATWDSSMMAWDGRGAT